MKLGDIISGFRLIGERDLGEYRVRGLRFRHTATGCEVLHLAAADTENLFAFCFGTPPRDDSGVSHITEHSVLSGSRRYPLKEPFSALMKGSMYTFLNALTYPDRTVYPASSCNRRDFFNLLMVYADAVFHPLLRRETFMQEAWRLEPAGADALRYAGIVYNEMKGAYSSPDAIVGEWTYRPLFPDTPYRHDSGGDPRSIPSLSVEALRAFHARYYHPSNCRIFLYGDIPTGEVLDFLEKNFLGAFARVEVDSTIPLQPRWSEPRRLEKGFPVKPGTPLEGRSTVLMSWLLPPVTDSLSLVTYEVLSEVLIGSAGSPLRKNLVDSGLGEDLSPVSGLETDFREMVFGVGLRGTDPHREEQVRSLVNDTLSSLCSRGLDRSLVTSTINRVEFRHREIRGNGSPYALRLMGRALRGWVHGGDPFASLEFSAVMARFKEILANDERHLERRIADDLLANNHRLTLVVGPDPEQERRDVEEESQRLETTVARLSPEEKGQVLREAEAFRAYQLAPDSPEVLSLIPSLHRGDLPHRVERIPAEDARTTSGIPLSLHDLFTNEIVYLDLCFPTGSIDAERALLLPLFGKAVCGSGLPGAGYDKIALELFRLTGGFSSSLDAGGIVGEPRSFGQFAFFRMRCLRALLPEGASLIGRLLASADFRDLGRLRDIVLELRNDMKSSLIPQGHHFAMLRAASRLSDSVAREETWRGISQLLFLEDLGKGLDEKLPGLAEKLEGIRADLFARSNLVANATAARECFGEIEKAVEDFASRLPAAPALVASAGAATSKTDAQRSAARSSAGPESAEIPRRTESAEIPRRTESAEIPRRTESAEIPRRGEAMISSSSVGYVARALRGFRYEEAESGAAAVLGHILSTSYLWEKVRMEGGAYGAFSYPRNTDGLFLFGSYRDPHIARTLRAFQDALDAAVRGDFGSSEVEKAVIGTVGREERPLDPGEKGFVSLQRKLHGVTDEVRQERRDRLVAVDPAALADAARKLRTFFDQGFSAVISNRKALGEAAAELPELGGRPVDLPE